MLKNSHAEYLFQKISEFDNPEVEINVYDSLDLENEARISFIVYHDQGIYQDFELFVGTRKDCQNMLIDICKYLETLDFVGFLV